MPAMFSIINPRDLKNFNGGRDAEERPDRTGIQLPDEPARHGVSAKAWFCSTMGGIGMVLTMLI